MTTIRTICVECGTVELTPDLVTLTDYGHEHRYEFECPHCDTPVSWTANESVRFILLTVGVREVEAAPIPDAVSDMLGVLRRHALETRFRYELGKVETIADMGWGA